MNSNNERKTIVLQVFPNLLEANLCKSKLLENGIDSFLLDENVIGLNPLGEVELKIFEEDLDKARILLTSD
ncbi:MAG: DUF2007 domain-containing protein [Saprospiraceae bacterium]|nr:DUF2007 domain-containing protein [Saprospiraceae bacterium]